MTLKKHWLLSLLLTFCTAFLMQWQGMPLKSEATPIGIVNLELANTEELFQKIMSIWDNPTVQLNIWLDFLFIPAYTYFFVSSLWWIREKHQNSWMKSAGQNLNILAYLACILDIVENIFMLFAIGGNYSGLSLQLMAIIASLKFICIAFILIYLIVSLPLILFGSKKS